MFLALNLSISQWWGISFLTKSSVVLLRKTNQVACVTNIVSHRMILTGDTYFLPNYASSNLWPSYRAANIKLFKIPVQGPNWTLQKKINFLLIIVLCRLWGTLPLGECQGGRYQSCWFSVTLATKESTLDRDRGTRANWTHSNDNWSWQQKAWVRELNVPISVWGLFSWRLKWVRRSWLPGCTLGRFLFHFYIF